MLAKCANPSCTETFRYLSKGRLFRLEADPVSHSYTSYPDSIQDEYYWLCPSCADEYTLHLEEGGRVGVIPMTPRMKEYQKAYAIVARSDGMMLRSVRSARLRPK